MKKDSVALHNAREVYMEERKELKNKMEQFLNNVEQMRDSIGGKNAEIEMFENELGKLESEKKTLEVYSYNQPELAEEKQEEIEKTEKELENLKKEKEKEDEKTKAELEKVEGPAAEITEILAEIEMFEDEIANLKQEKLQLETYNHDWPELAEEKQEEIEKTEKQIDELYEQLGKYKDVKINVKNAQIKKEEKTEETKSEVEQKEPEKEEKPEVESKAINEDKKLEENIGKAGTINPNKMAELNNKEEMPESNDKALKKVSRWDKFRESCKNVWNKVKKNFTKVALALGVATSAVGPAVIENKTEADKTEEKAVTHKETRTVPVNVEELQVGDAITVDGDLTYYHTSDMVQPVGVTGNRTENGDNLDVIITYTMPGNAAPIHISLNPNGNENLDLDVDQNSDLGWVMSNELQDHVLDKVEEYEVTETVENKTTKTENTFNPVVREDAKAVGETADKKATKDAESIARSNINKSTEPKDKPNSKVASARDKFKESLRVDNSEGIDKLLEQFDTKALEEKMEKFKMNKANKTNNDKEKDSEEER